MDGDLTPLASGARVLVAGARVTGRAIVAALADWDVRLTVCDDDVDAARALGGAGALTPRNRRSRRSSARTRS